ncbi:MAG TPA: alcohol dehydrogenase, partial [Pirellulaceae bacterium]|nr:alcohol dehydrogenase [Pirellulaceae bacterium]
MAQDSTPDTSGAGGDVAPGNKKIMNNAGAGSPFRPLRAWPILVLIAAMIVARFVPGWFEDGPSMLWMVAAFGPLLACLLLLIWWLAASRARWQERLAGFFGVIAIAVVSIMLADRSMQGPATSM